MGTGRRCRVHGGRRRRHCRPRSGRRRGRDVDGRNGRGGRRGHCRRRSRRHRRGRSRPTTAHRWCSRSLRRRSDGQGGRTDGLLCGRVWSGHDDEEGDEFHRQHHVGHTEPARMCARVCLTFSLSLIPHPNCIGAKRAPPKTSRWRFTLCDQGMNTLRRPVPGHGTGRRRGTEISLSRSSLRTWPRSS
jgi:hypothetical protein